MSSIPEPKQKQKKIVSVMMEFFNFKENCRFCLKNTEKLSVKTIDKRIRQDFKDATGTELKSSKNYPKSVCTECLEKLDSCLSIKNELLESQNQLHKSYKELRRSQKCQDEEDEISTIYIKTEPDINLNSDYDHDSCSDDPEIKFSTTEFYKDQQIEDQVITSVERVPCPECGVLVRPKHLKIHNQIVHLQMKDSFECDVCGKRLLKRIYMETHLKKHLQAKDFNCPSSDCGRTFTSRNNMMSHFKRIHSMDQMCNICFKVIKSKDQLASHIAAHHSRQKLHFCDVKKCNKGFYYLADLSKHKKSIHNIVLRPRAVKNVTKLLNCSSCKKTFSSENHLRIHEQSHETQKLMVPCETCGIMLKKKSYKSHIELMHLNIRRFSCDHCPKAFTRKSKILNHLKSHFKIRDIPCNECKMQFSSRTTLINHVKVIHRGLQIYQIRTCEFCGKTFNNKTFYDSHVRSKHTGERPFVCDYVGCPKTYTSSSELLKHKRASHVNPVECTICSRIVKNIKAHTERHFKKKEKNFVCDLIENGQPCNRRFTSSSYLNKHIDINHRGNTYNCTQCDATYCKQFNLDQHIKNVHEQRRIKCELCPTLLTRKDYYIKHIQTSHSNLDELKKKNFINAIRKMSKDELFNYQK